MASQPNPLLGPATGAIWPANNPVGTETLRGMESADPGFQPGVQWGGQTVSRPMYDMAQGAIQNALGWAGGTNFRAYHGSPYQFSRFDSGQIGSGEGAQAYGHGLYFAENEATAKAYRDNLARPTELYVDGKPLTGSGMTGQEMRAARFIEDAGGWGIARQRMVDAIMAETDPAKKAVLGRDYQALLDLSPRVSFGGPYKGSMYEVQINRDPEHFLDWDKPLSQQSQHVRDRLDLLRRSNNVPEKNNVGEETTGGQMMEYLIDRFRRDRTIPDPHVAVANELRGEGIPGIRYLDAGSRGTKEGSRNAVVFDDSIIEILRRYGIAGLLGGGAAAAVATPSQANTNQLGPR